MKYFFNSRTSAALAPNTCRFMIQELSGRRERNEGRRGDGDGTTTEDDERRESDIEDEGGEEGGERVKR